MICPFCSSNQISVTNSRPTNKGTQIWRRRKCLKCQEIFTTREKIDISYVVVEKRDGRRVEYSHPKLYSGIYHSFVGRKKIDRGEGTVGALINDTALYDDAKSLVSGINRNRIMRNLVRQTVRDGDAPAEENSSSVKD